MKMVTKIEGLRELGENIKMLNAEMQAKIAPAMTGAAAKVVQKAAIVNAPDSEGPHEIDGVVVQPGNLKKNIISKRIKQTRLTAETIVTVRGKERYGYASRYGSMVEHGTVKMAANPYLRPALDKNLKAAADAMRTGGERRIKSLKLKAAKKRVGK